MYIIIAGCGRFGRQLALNLSNEGQDVAVIDSDSSHFESLGSGFNGMEVAGMPFDEDVLQEAEVMNADAVAAVTDDDNVNLMISVIASNLYHIDRVLTRISEPDKVSTFEKMGFRIICPIQSASVKTEQMLSGKDII